MPMNHVCPLCEEGVAREEVYSADIKVGRKTICVEGLRKSVCELCGGETVFEEQLKNNDELYQKAVSKDRGTVSVGMLRSLRDEWCLTQTEASQLFGAGANSFAKWESMQANLSTPSALLVRLAATYPEVVPYLASLCDFKLNPESQGLRRSRMAGSSRRGAYETIHLHKEDASNVVFIHAPALARASSRADKSARWLEQNAWKGARA